MLKINQSVLLFCEELFNHFPTGGGRMYELIIKENPHIKFTSYSSFKSNDATRPTNLEVITLNQNSNLGLLSNYLNSVEGRSFDFLDIPDWILSEIPIRRLLKKHNVRVNKIVVGLHGNNSNILSKLPQNFISKESLAVISELEKKLYDSADFVYGISTSYSKMLGLENKFRYINPFNFIKFNGAPHRTMREITTAVFEGRKESTKGYGKFLEWVPDLVSAGYRTEIYGPGAFRWDEYLYFSKMERGLGNLISANHLLTEKEIKELYLDESKVFIFPSLFDSFNLAAADAAFSGARCLMSENVMSLNFIKKHSPKAAVSILPLNTSGQEVVKCISNSPNLETMPSLDIIESNSSELSQIYA